MLTMNCIVEKKYPLSHELTAEDKNNLLKENKDKNYSYYCLLREMLGYKTSVEGLLRGWGGVILFNLK
jgi:hypothetical protein